MPWSSSNRRARFNKGWYKKRKQILDRDHHVCQWPVEDGNGFPAGICGRPARAVDHRRHDMAHDDDRDSNLWSLCDWHHNIKTQMESAEGKRKRARRNRERAYYDHPAFK
ncbi:MAG: HNH endonuclease [Bifidobacterium sp.]|nr:HNH endonuclease [Bifidobacterium sp.]